MANFDPIRSPWREDSFSRDSMTPSPGPLNYHARQHSVAISSPISSTEVLSHQRNNSLSMTGSAIFRSDSKRFSRFGSTRTTSQASGTFAPQFIKDEELQRSSPRVNHIEGENDFSGKRYVWLKDEEKTFVQGWVVREEDDGLLTVQFEDGSRREVDADEIDKVNPAKFDKVDDMAELTYLNEPAVIHNLRLRYSADLIYTYSGLFLVAINPYGPLPIYTREYINMYRGRSREDTKPHIFAVAEEAFRNLVEEGRNQSILVTGESGAGKTENTKKVIQYLASVAMTEAPAARSPSKGVTNLSQQILKANPILEAFGNAQTVRNNNSSRFGKFIRIQLTRTGQIAGAHIDWYLLEKSRVVRLNPNERNYHIFYQLLRGADELTKRDLSLAGKEVEDFEYTKNGNDVISGISDKEEWRSLVEALHVMGIPDFEQKSIFRTVAAILQLGNITVTKESLRADQASFDDAGRRQARLAARLLGIAEEPFIQALLHPRVKAGREWVDKVQTPEQVRLSIDALSKGIYERGFGNLVDRINACLDTSAMTDEDTHYIGVLDIAGFEIFENNSFEQLCINYTNERLQQFFNHHMFVLEQEEYAREQIEWKFIDFGRDLQPTIDLIELANPIGIFSCLDEDSVMPKATDKSFTEKLHSLWDQKTPKYRKSLLNQGFMLTHYAAEVEYDTDGWLEKNKDPLNDNVTRLLASSSNDHIANLFADCADSDEDQSSGRSRVKKGLFRTVAQRHKEQLSTLMNQLHSTHPHFVRCILPNHKKKSKLFDAGLILDQLRCNGVLEGIRIARTGFPNRLPFAEFRSRYEVLCKTMPHGYLESQQAAKILLEKLELDPSAFRVGLTKVFFRSGVLAELEDQRDSLIREVFSRFQSLARGFIQRRATNKKLYRAEAARIIHKNFQVYLDLQQNPWWRLFVRMKPMLGATRQNGELKRRDDLIQKLEKKAIDDVNERQKVDDERRRAELDKQRLLQVLESERALALDKEEIFKRLQEREVELSDKLAGALEDQNSLETQIDELLAAKQKAESKTASLRSDLEQAGQLVENLETEKRKLVEQVSGIMTKMDDLESTRSRASNLEQSLSSRITQLDSQLIAKDRDIQGCQNQVRSKDDKIISLEAQLKNQALVLDSAKAQDAQERQSLIDEVRELTNQGQIKDCKITDLERKLITQQENLEKKESRFSEAEETIKRDLKMLSSQLGSKDRKIQELEAKSFSAAGDAKDKLVIMTKELQAAKIELSQLDAENQLLQDKLSNNDSLVRSREADLDLHRKQTEPLRKQLEDMKLDNWNLRKQAGEQAKKQEDQISFHSDEARIAKNNAIRWQNENESLREQLDSLRDESSRHRDSLDSASRELESLRNEKENRSVNDEENRKLSSRHSRYQSGLRNVHSELDSVKSQLQDDMKKSQDKIESLMSIINALHTTAEAAPPSTPTRTQRELQEEREKGVRLERELEGWKALRMERAEVRRNASVRHNPLGDIGSGNAQRRRSRQTSISSTLSGENAQHQQYAGNEKGQQQQQQQNSEKSQQYQMAMAHQYQQTYAQIQQAEPLQRSESIISSKGFL